MNILSEFISWYFLEVPKKIVLGWKNFLKFNLQYFSVFFSLKTLFSPWRRYIWTYPKGFDIGKYLETFFSNLISRTLGAILRFFLITFGILVEIFIIFIGIIVLFVWLFLPVFLIFGLIFGFKIIIQ